MSVRLRDPHFKLRFRLTRVHNLAARYAYGDDVAEGIGEVVRPARSYTQAQFLELCRWKSVRTQPRCEENDAALVEAVTTVALTTPHEQLRIEVLTLLRGVSWPTASVLLHFGHRDPYPIVDYRALWSLGIDEPPARYDFPFWWAYVRTCRKLAADAGVSMRILDRALWQYSKENQATLRSP